MNNPQNDDPFAAGLEDFPQHTAPQPSQQSFGFQPTFVPQGAPGQFDQQQAPPNGTPAPTEPMIPWSQAMQLLRSPQQQAPAPAAPPPTPEQIAAHLRQFQPDDTFVEAFITALERGEDGKRNPAAIKKALSAMIEGMRVENLRALELHGEARDASRQQSFAPLQKFVDDQRSAQVWTEFSSMFPGLAQFRDFVDMTASRVDPRALPPGTTKQQFYMYVANSVGQELQRMGIQVDLTPAQPGQQPSSQQPQPAAPFQRPAPHVPAMQTMTHGAIPRGGPARPQNGNPYFDAESFR